VASVLQQVAEGLRDERELVGLVEAELAMARGSSRVMAALPLGALLLGTLVGADPLGFLIRSPFGVVLALVGVSLAALGVVWTERLAARA
jgi:type II secretion system F domain protein